MYFVIKIKGVEESKHKQDKERNSVAYKCAKRNEEINK